MMRSEGVSIMHRGSRHPLLASPIQGEVPIEFGAGFVFNHRVAPPPLMGEDGRG
jgi:hypothetical protein